MTLIMMRPKTTQAAFIGTLKPNVDIAKVNWEDELGGTTNIFNSIDDDSASTFIITDEILMAFCGGSEEQRTCRFHMSNPSPLPSGAEDVTVRVRARYKSSASNPSIDMTIKLFQGGTLKATSSLSALTGSHVWYIDFLTQAQKDSVSDWTDVRVDVDMSICENAGDPIFGEIEEMEITFT